MTAPDPTPDLVGDDPAGDDPAGDDIAGDDLCPRCGHEVVDAWLVCAWCGTPLAVAAELPVGTRLGGERYQILRVLGRGGFGITYEVGDRRLKRRVAMKELFPDSAVRHGSLVLTPPQARVDFRAARDRFLREARVLARFTHPGIVRVYEVFEEHGTAYLIMELLQGRTLVDLLHDRGRPFEQEEVLDVAGRVAAALRPVHAAGVLHRDVNPANVMLTDHGRIVVIDFGLARDYDQSQTEGMTRVVTPGYAPLEQYRGEGRFGPPTDVYGLAATCYRLATGQVPVSAVERDGGRELPSPQRLNSAISKQVGDAILDGLELDPGHRPRDLDSFLARLGITRLPESPRSILLDDRDDLGGRAARGTPTGGGGSVEGGAGSGGAGSVGGGSVGGATSGWDGPVDGDVTVVEPRPPGAKPTDEASGWHDPDRTIHEVSPEADLTRHDDGPGHGDVTRHDDDPGRGGADGVARPVPARSLMDRLRPDRRPSGTAAPVGSATGSPFVGSFPPPRLPGPVGPHQAGRRKITVPAVAVALATASVAPVAATAVIVLVALPWLATVGDGAVQRMRDAHGLGSSWAASRWGPGALAPVRYVRNLVVSLVRAVPVIGMGAVLIGAWYAFESLDAPRALLDLGLRSIGLVVVGALLATLRDGSGRFRTGFGIDELVARWVPDGRTSERVVVGWVVAVALVAGSLWLSPDPFPLP